MDSGDSVAHMSEDNFPIAKDACSDIPFLPNPHTLSHGNSSITGHMEIDPVLLPDNRARLSSGAVP